MDRDALLHQAAGAAVDRDTAQALSLLRQLLDAEPDDLDALLLRGHVIEMTGDPPGARSSYERVLELDPRNVRALIDLADCDVWEGMAQAALARLDQAEQLVHAGLHHSDRDEELQEILENKFNCLQVLGRATEAREILEQCERLFPGAPFWRELARNTKPRSG